MDHFAVEMDPFGKWIRLDMEKSLLQQAGNGAIWAFFKTKWIVFEPGIKWIRHINVYQKDIL